MEEEWQTATGGRRRRKQGGGGPTKCQQHAAPQATKTHAIATQPPTERQVQRCCTAVDAAAAELAAAPFWLHLSQQLAALPHHCSLPKLERMVVYGLGSLEQPGAVHIRYQLAAAKLLALLLPALAAAAEAFDPVFTQLDHAALAHCGIQALTQDEGGRRRAHQPTLFFMPHCEAVLTDALLATNLAAGTLHNVVILGNRFSGYQQSWGLRNGTRQQEQNGSKAVERPDTMLRLHECGAAQELPVSECGFPVASAFNDLGLHWFRADWRQQLPTCEAAAVSDCVT